LVQEGKLNLIRMGHWRFVAGRETTREGEEGSGSREQTTAA
jgi:hypothetical protein